MNQQIKSTTNYNHFKFSPLNRKPSIRHVDRLIESIKKCNQLDINPIIVNFDGYIISGQHRFLACRKMGLPVYYIEKDVPDEYILIANQNQHSCAIADAIEYYVQKESNRNYIILQKYANQFHLTPGAVAMIIGANGGRHREVQGGKFQLKYTEAECDVRMQKYKDLLDFLKSMPFEYKGTFVTKMFCQGFASFLDCDIDWDVFMRKLRLNWNLLDTAMPTYAKWQEQLMKVYHKRNRTHMEAYD